MVQLSPCLVICILPVTVNARGILKNLRNISAGWDLLGCTVSLGPDLIVRYFKGSQ